MSAPLTLRDASVAQGGRTLWSDLSLTVEPGEFLAVLGANGSGKTTLLRAVLGLVPLASGEVDVDGHPARRGDPAIGYVPQQKGFDRDLGVRGRDLVGLGYDGFRYGLRPGGAAKRSAVDAVLAAVGASGYADEAIGRLSGGEQQRLRVAQALLNDPRLLLCDEPLLSLDLASQRAVTALIDARRRALGCAVVFVTHEIDPVLPYVDRVLYLAGGRFAVGTPDEVITSERLTELYGVPIEVFRHGGSVFITGTDAADAAAEHHP